MYKTFGGGDKQLAIEAITKIKDQAKLKIDELEKVIKSRVFKDSEAVLTGKKDKIVINNREFDAKTVKTLDDADQLKSDKKHFEVAIPAITKTIKEVKVPNCALLKGSANV